MKRAIIAVISVMVAATLLAAQTQAPPTGAKPPAQQQQTPPAQGQQPGAQPGQAQPGQPEQPAGPRPPQAKTQEEYNAFQTAAALNDPVQLEAAATDFATKFPQSELRELLFQKDLSLYQNTNNADKVVELGRKILVVNPNSAGTLASVASALSNSTRKTDLDAAQKWDEATKDANQALELIQNGKDVPPAGIPQANLEPYKHLVTSIAYSALGAIAFNKENYPDAEKNLKQSVSFNDIQQDPVSWLQLAVALDKQNKYPEALATAEKCVALGPGSATDLCKQESERLKKLTGAKPAGAPPATKPQAPPQ